MNDELKRVTRLLFVVTEDWYFASHRLQLALTAKDAGFDVMVATRFTTHEHQFAEMGMKPLSVALPRRSLQPLTLFVSIWKLYRLYRRERPTIIHHVSLVPVVLGSIAARLAGIQSVNAITGLGWLFMKDSESVAAKLVRFVLRTLPLNSRVIVQNPDDKKFLLDVGVSHEIINLIPGAGVDATQFHPLPLPPGTPVVMLASRLLWDKGIGEFVEAAKQLKGEGIDARFVLVGDPDYDNPATVPQDIIDEWVASGIVEWWGRRLDMCEVLNSAHVICLPSYREGLPKVLLEAAACGRAIVTTDTPGCREVVRNGYNGVLVPVKDSMSLAHAIRGLIENDELRSTMGHLGREMAETEFSIEQINGATLKIYRDMIL